MPLDPLQELYTKTEQLDELKDSHFTYEEIAWLKNNIEKLRCEVLDVQANEHLAQIKNVAEMMLNQERQARLNCRDLSTLLIKSQNFHGIPLPQAHHTESDTGVMTLIHKKE